MKGNVNYLELANSPLMWVSAAIAVGIVVFQSVLFFRKSLIISPVKVQQLSAGRSSWQPVNTFICAARNRTTQQDLNVLSQSLFIFLDVLKPLAELNKWMPNAANGLFNKLLLWHGLTYHDLYGFPCPIVNQVLTDVDSALSWFLHAHAIKGVPC